jgi:hypothetical protein
MGYLAAGFDINQLQTVSYFANGTQLTLLNNGHFLAAVPVPAAAWLMGSGLIGLISVKRRQQRLTV